MGKEALDIEVFKEFSIETLQHISQFCTSVSGMAELIKERMPEGYQLTNTGSQYAVEKVLTSPNTTPDDTITIADDGSLLNL